MAYFRGFFRQIRTLSVSNKFTLLSLLILIIISAFRQIYSPDVGFHTKGGLWILQNLKFPGKDMFTYTVGDHDYFDLQWLYDITLAITDTLFGEFGLVASNALLVVISFILVLFRITRNVNLSELPNWQWLFFLAICSVACLFEPRPHTFSWLYLNLLFIILDEYMERGNNILIFLPLIMLLWTNTHSVFILGWIVIGCYMLGSVWNERRLWTPVIKYGLISICISIINPYFFKGVAYPFRQFQLLQSSNIFKNSISELLSPISIDMYFINGAFVLFQPLFWFHIFLFVSIIFFVIRLKRIKIHELLVFLVFLYLACTAIKNIGFYIFAILPATIQASQSKGITEILSKNRLFLRARIQTILNIIVILSSVIMIIAVSTNSYYISYRSNFRFGFKYSNLLLPYEASKYLLSNNLDGRILNDIQSGGFLIYILPQKVSIDGRLEVMGEEFFSKYSFLWNSIKKDRILAEYRPDIVIFPYVDEFFWVHHFKQDTAWRLLYFDEMAAIYVKKGYADSVPPLAYAEQLSQYEYIDSTQIDSILRRDYPNTYEKFRLIKKYFPINEIRLSTFCYYDDHFEEAIQIGLHGLLKSTDFCPELYYDLGLYFYENKEFMRSAYCFERFLETNSDALAVERVKKIRAGDIPK